MWDSDILVIGFTGWETEKADPFGLAILLCAADGTANNAALVWHGAYSKLVLLL